MGSGREGSAGMASMEEEGLPGRSGAYTGDVELLGEGQREI